MKQNNTIRLNTSIFKLQISFELVRTVTKLPTFNAILPHAVFLQNSNIWYQNVHNNP